jgi:hypothetical protein
MPPPHSKKWSDAVVDPSLMKEVERMFSRLLALDFSVGEENQLVPVTLSLTPKAHREWVRFYNEHAQEQASARGEYAAALSKLEGGAARLALLIHLVRQAADDLTVGEAVDEDSVFAGTTLARWFAHEARRIYTMLQESAEEQDRRQTVEFIRRRGGQITARDLQRGVRQFRDSPEGAEEALNELAKAGYGVWEPAHTGNAGGRPTRVFRLLNLGNGLQDARVFGRRDARVVAVLGRNPSSRLFAALS